MQNCELLNELVHRVTTRIFTFNPNRRQSITPPPPHPLHIFLLSLRFRFRWLSASTAAVPPHAASPSAGCPSPQPGPVTATRQSEPTSPDNRPTHLDRSYGAEKSTPASFNVSPAFHSVSIIIRSPFHSTLSG
jgi:hypothetical protein